MNNTAKAPEEMDRIQYYFNPVHAGRYDWDKISLIEKERPKQIKAIRAFCDNHRIRATGVRSVFNYHVNWSFARIEMGWRYHEDPLTFRKLLMLCYQLIEPYPDIKINILSGNIEFVTKSPYIKNEALDEKFKKECEYPKNFIQHFPVKVWKKAQAFIQEEKEYLDSLLRVNPFGRSLNFSICNAPSMKTELGSKIEEKALKRGVNSLVSFDMDCLKQNALKVKKALESKGFLVDMTMGWPGHYTFALYDVETQNEETQVGKD